MGTEFSVWDDEKLLETDGGNGCTAIWMYFPVNCHLKMVQMVSFTYILKIILYCFMFNSTNCWLVCYLFLLCLSNKAVSYPFSVLYLSSSFFKALSSSSALRKVLQVCLLPSILLSPDQQQHHHLGNSELQTFCSESAF